VTPRLCGSFTGTGGCHSTTLNPPISALRSTHLTNVYEQQAVRNIRVVANSAVPLPSEHHSHKTLRRNANRSTAQLKERNARFTHLFVFLQCLILSFTCVTRENRTREPLCHAAPVAGEADQPSPILSFALFVSCTRLTDSSFSALCFAPWFPRLFGRHLTFAYRQRSPHRPFPIRDEPRTNSSSPLSVIRAPSTKQCGQVGATGK
jgi:hypothetical protein